MFSRKKNNKKNGGRIFRFSVEKKPIILFNVSFFVNLFFSWIFFSNKNLKNLLPNLLTQSHLFILLKLFHPLLLLHLLPLLVHLILINSKNPDQRGGQDFTLHIRQHGDENAESKECSESNNGCGGSNCGGVCWCLTADAVESDFGSD